MQRAFSKEEIDQFIFGIESLFLWVELLWKKCEEIYEATIKLEGLVGGEGFEEAADKEEYLVGTEALGPVRIVVVEK